MTSKVVRLQFRTKRQMQSAASSVNGHKNGDRAREAQQDQRKEHAQN
jgi:hypothetical protein